MAEKKIDSALGGKSIHTDQSGIWRITDVMISRYQLAQEKLIIAVDDNDQRKLFSSYLSVVGLIQTILPFVNIDDNKEQKKYKEELEEQIEDLKLDLPYLMNRNATNEDVLHQVLGQQKLIGESIKQMNKLGILVERNVTGDTGGYNLDA